MSSRDSRSDRSLMFFDESEMGEIDDSSDFEKGNVTEVLLPITCLKGCPPGNCSCGVSLNETSPILSYQNYGKSDGYSTDVHCHEAKPIYSNARAKRKLTVASIVCLLFVIAEAIG